jgi:hypothetical protein
MIFAQGKQSIDVLIEKNIDPIWSIASCVWNENVNIIPLGFCSKDSGVKPSLANLWGVIIVLLCLSRQDNP